MKQKIQAAVFDVDGTLYDYKTHSIPQSTAEAIERLRAQGVRIVIASGRSSALLGEQVIQTVRPDYYVLANGHEMLDKTARRSVLCGSQRSRPSGSRALRVR